MARGQIEPVRVNIKGASFELRANFDRHNGHFIECLPLDAKHNQIARQVVADFKGELERRFGIAHPREMNAGDQDVDTVPRSDGIHVTRGYWRDKDESDSPYLKASVYRNGFIEPVDEDHFGLAVEALKAVLSSAHEKSGTTTCRR